MYASPGLNELKNIDIYMDDLQPDPFKQSHRNYETMKFNTIYHDLYSEILF